MTSFFKKQFEKRKRSIYAKELADAKYQPRVVPAKRKDVQRNRKITLQNIQDFTEEGE